MPKRKKWCLHLETIRVEKINIKKGVGRRRGILDNRGRTDIQSGAFDPEIVRTTILNC